MLTHPRVTKTEELLTLVAATPDWRTYVGPITEEVVAVLLRERTLAKTANATSMRYTTVRAHVLLALERIKAQRTDFLRYGRSTMAQELWDILAQQPDWAQHLTSHEVAVVRSFIRHRNFYLVGAELGIKPSNAAAVLYGSTQKLGVVGKLRQLQLR